MSNTGKLGKWIICAFIITQINATGQTVLYSTNFGTNGSWPTGWTTTGWTESNSSASDTYTTCSGAAASGSYNAEDNSANGSTLTYNHTLSTVGYTNIVVTWGGRETSTASAPTFQWSVNGGTTWNSPSAYVDGSGTTWGLVNGGTSITLGAGAAGAANLEFRWTANSSSGNYRMDDFCVEGTVAGGCPSTAASGITFNATCAGITVNWTNGNGSNRIVVAYPTSTITAPTNGTTYTANTTYGNGTAVGAGATKGYTVYNGTGSTVTVTGLTAGTTYYFEVYEYNTTACYTGMSAAASQLAVTAPTAAATGLTFPGVNCGDVVLDWTPGNGSNEIVVAYTGALTAPTNGTTYTANSTYGSGSLIAATEYVVFNGAGSTVHVYGLTANTTYHFAIFEYNGNSCYYATSLTGSQTTSATPTTASNAPTLTAVTCSGATATVSTPGNGADRIIVASTAAITAPATGTVYSANSAYGSGSLVAGTEYVVYKGTGSAVTVTGLLASTTYYFASFEYNGTSCYLSTINSSHTTTTACAGCPASNATGLGYSNITCNGMKVSWTNTGGSNALVIAYPISTITTPTNGTTYTANAAYGSGTAVGAGYVVYSGAGTSVTVSGLSASTTYYFAVYEYTTTACYLTPGLSSSQATIACGGCPTTTASALSFTHIGCNSVIASWTNGNGSNRIVVIYPNSTITNPVNTTAYTADYNYGGGTSIGAGFVVYNGTGNSVTILGLSASTTYYVAVFEYNTTACYLTPGTSSNVTTTSCSQCPVLVTIMTDACDDNGVTCEEGNSEFFLLSTGTYGWDNGAGSPTIMYGSTTAGTTHTVSTYQSESVPTATLNSAVVSCGTGNFIDASAGGIAIPAWSTIMLGVSDEPTYDFCPNLYNFSSLCAATKPIYVLYGNNTNLVYTGNFLNHQTPAGTDRYFIADFSSIGAGCSTQYYEYDADLESNGNGASETWRAPISTSSASPTTPTYNPISCGLSATLLPIKLLSFTGSYNVTEGIVNLYWATGTELDNKSFEVQKSSDGITWNLVTTVSGKGNSIQEVDYTAIDDNPFQGLSYYRLKQNDLDGNFTYSNVIAIDVTSTNNSKLKLIPNPSDNTTTISFNATTEYQASLNIYDVTGRAIDNKQINVIKGINSYVLNTSGYSNGVYLINLNGTAQQYSTKLVVNHL